MFTGCSSGALKTNETIITRHRQQKHEEFGDKQIRPTEDVIRQVADVQKGPRTRP